MSAIWRADAGTKRISAVLACAAVCGNPGHRACGMTWHWTEFGQQLSLYHIQFLTSLYFAGAASGGEHSPAASWEAQEICQERASWFREPGLVACGAAVTASPPDQALSTLAGSR